MRDETLMRTMLFDYYGALLTEKQSEYYDLHYNNDLSLREIAAQTGASRQAVWDIIRRAENTMRALEDKTSFVQKAAERRQALSALRTAAETLPQCPEKVRVFHALETLEALEN